MRYKQTFARLLFALQILQCFAAPTMLHASPVVDAPELMDIDVPSRAVFQAIKKHWLRADLKESEKKTVPLSLSVENLEKLAKETPVPEKSKVSSRLRGAILNFFADTSPVWETSTRFTKGRDWEDLQLFSGKTTLVEAVDRSLLQCGTAYTGALLVSRPPISATLQRRNLIASFIDRSDKAEELRKLIQSFADQEEQFFSNTILPEDEAVKLSVEDLRPGWLLQKLPKKLFSENPNFLRFHALITQKTAPFFWNPLGKLKNAGLSTFGVQFPIWMLFVPWRFNGIPQAIFKDWMAYTAHKSQDDRKFSNALKTASKARFPAAEIGLATTKLCAKNILPYWYKHLFPYNKPVTALKAFAGLVNDLFLWNTVELRRACAQPPRERPWSINDIFDPRTTPESPAATTTHRIPPPHLGDGRLLSLSSNSQDNNLFTPVISTAMRWTHNIYFGRTVPDRTVNSPTSFIGIFRQLFATQTKQAIKNGTIPSTLAMPIAVIANAADATSLSTAAEAVTTSAPQAAANVLTTLWRGTAGLLTRAISPQPAAPHTAGAGESAIERATQTTPHTTDTPEASQRSMSIQSRARSALEDASTNFIHYLEAPSEPAKPTPSRRKVILAVQLLSWVLVSYLYDAWRTRNDEKKVKINILDKIMFNTVKPAMELLNTTSKIDAILQENKLSFPLPNSLALKLTAYQNLTQTTCKEFATLAQRPTFRKATGHRILDHTGDVRRAYTLLQNPQSREVLRQAIHVLAELDSYLGIAKLSQEYGEGDNRICPVDFINNDTPFFNAKNAWFALLGKNAIGSDITMGNGSATNMLLTGINGGGKSIMLKTTVFSLILAHIFGFTTAQQCSMTPFAELNLHLSSLDNAAEGKSRWVAEAEAIVSMINSAEDIHSDGYFVFISGDELGDGTAPDASIKVMVKMLTAITSRTNVLSFISSHLQPLTELEKTLTRLKNFRINPNRKLEPGINTVNIAFEVFQKFSNTKKKADGFAAALSQQTTQPHIAMIA
jgi:hypothetical protein